MEKTDTAVYESNLDSEYVKTWGTATFEAYRFGAKVKFEPISKPEDMVRGVRDVIKDQSNISRHRCAFAFGNATCDWFATSLLTWRFPPTRDAVKDALDMLRRRWRSRWGESPDAWLMEMQQRGVPHFHLFHATESNFGVACRVARLEQQTVRGKPVEVLRGGVDFWLRETWMDCIRCHDEATAHFNGLRMIQKLRHPQAAGMYAAKEAAKREQKILPDDYSEGLGRWWWLNPRWKPAIEHRGKLDLSRWPYAVPLSHVWRSDDLTAAVTDVEFPRVALNLETGESWLEFASEHELPACEDSADL